MKLFKGDQRKLIRTSHTFRRLIFSYLFIFIIPFLCLSCTLYMLLVHYTNNEITGIHVAQAVNLLQEVRQIEDRFLDIREQLQYDSSIQQSYHPSMADAARKLMNRLYALKSSHSAIQEIWYTSCNNDYLFSSTSSISVKMFTGWRYPGVGYDVDQFMNMLHKSRERIVLQSVDALHGDSVLIFAYPVLHNSIPVTYHKVLFVVSEASVGAVGSRVLEGIQGGLFFYFGGQPIVQCGSMENPENAYDLLQSRSPDRTTIANNGTLVRIYASANRTSLFAESGEWSLIFQVKSMFAARSRLLYMVAVAGAVLLLFGFMISMLSAQSAYSPIAQLRRKTIELTQTDVNNLDSTAFFNDFNAINQHLNLLAQQREALKRQLSVLMNERNELLAQSISDPNDSAITQMQRYIQTNCMRCDFSLKRMAADFSMTESGLSRYFRKQTGAALLDYMTNLRLQQAILLLKSSDLPIQEIGAMVGYNNTNSFIRRFKQIMDLTPGEYRKQMNHHEA